MMQSMRQTNSNFSARPIWIAMLMMQSLILFLASSNSTANTSSERCDQKQIATLKNELLGLTNIEQNFNQLATGSLARDFSLLSLFTVDLRDNKAVKDRAQDLKKHHPPTYVSNCKDPSLQILIHQRNQALDSISETRLRYLSLDFEERRYLISLISIFQRLQNDLYLIANNKLQMEKDIANLQALLNELEREFKTLQNPEDRTALFERISNTNNELQTLVSISEQESTQATAITPLLNLSNALIIDYHQFYKLYSVPNNKQLALPLFNQLASPPKLREMIQLAIRQQTGESDYQTVLAALIIIHGRLYIKPRQQEPLGDLVSKPYTDLRDELKHELKTLMATPIANLHLKLSNDSMEHHYLSKTLSQSAANFVYQVIALLLFWAFLKRIPIWINRWQQNLVRNHLSQKFSRQLIALLRILQPNSAWLSAMAFYYYLDASPLRDWILLYDVAAIIAFYLLIKTLATWAISNTNGKAHLFILRSKQITITHHCHRFALYITLSAVFYIILNTLLRGGILCTVYQAVLIVIIWLFSYRLIGFFQPEFSTHLSKRVSEHTFGYFNRLQRPLIKVIVNPIIFLLLQLQDLIIAIHNRLLRIESYQTITAKFLKIRLEQSQTNTESTDKDAQYDTHYENWFLSKELIAAKPNLLIKSPWLKDIVQNVEEWLDNKQDENDLVLVGESGIGKSTLLKQWLNQWDKCKTTYLKTPSKTTTSHDIFKLVCDALELPDCEDIAQFVIQQQQMEKTVIVIDEAHHLFLSDVGGFEAYKMLQSLISAKLENVFWIIAINHQSWIYLNDVFSRTYQFSTTIAMQRWTQQDIRDLILRRHRASRRQLTYDDLLLASTSHSETATQAAESRCFSLLWDQSAGIPSVALAIWIDAARNPAKGQIEMGIPERPGSNTMLNLTDDHLFVYASLVIHESLNTQQAQAVTHLSEAIVRRALKLGLDQGFLVRKSYGRYIINPLWQLQLCQLLRRKNFLHE